MWVYKMETKRLIIRKFAPDDWQDLYEYLSQEAVVKFEPYETLTKEASKQEATKRSKDDKFWAVCLKDSKKLIGNITLSKQDFGTWELGYVFNQKYQGMGYATESAEFLINDIFKNRNARRVTAMCNPLNESSWRLLERLGFRREGHLIKNIYFKKDKNDNPIWADTYEYGILNSEWFMSFINPPSETPQNITHKTFYSKILSHKVGYNIYLPPCYADSDEKYPVVYHLHGWTCNESSEIWPLEKTCRDRRAITVFANVISSEKDYLDALLQIEDILVNELIPHIDGQYRTDTTREGRALSGFSMGGNMAFYFAVKHHALFGAVTPYAGTYHHLYHKDANTVDVAPEKAAELYEGMIREKRHFEENNILSLVRQNAEKIRGKLNIKIHIGTADILFCDNEILHLYLDSLDIPHEYKVVDGIGHELDKIV